MHLEKQISAPIWILFLNLGFWLGFVVWFDLIWCGLLAWQLFPPLLTKVTLSISSCTDQVDGSCNSYYNITSYCTRFPSDFGSLWQDRSQSCSGYSDSSFSLLLITARCGVCFRRIMFPILTTVLFKPGDLYNHTECKPGVWKPSCLNVGMCTVQKYRQTSCWFWHLM